MSFWQGIFVMLVYLVVGGYPDIASTELLIDGMLAWTMTGPLPRPLWGLQVVSITVSNKIIATGRIKFKHLSIVRNSLSINVSLISFSLYLCKQNQTSFKTSMIGISKPGLV